MFPEHGVSPDLPGLCRVCFSFQRIATGLIGDPTAPVIGSAGPTNMNSYTLSAAQAFDSSSSLKISPMVRPMIGIQIQCQGWLASSQLLGRTSTPQVSVATAATCLA